MSKEICVYPFLQALMPCLPHFGAGFQKKFLNRREGPEVPLDFADSGFVLIKCLK
jgi:hypothetical protein